MAVSGRTTCSAVTSVVTVHKVAAASLAFVYYVYIYSIDCYASFSVFATSLFVPGAPFETYFSSLLIISYMRIYLRCNSKARYAYIVYCVDECCV